jgi:hypothetical protein
MAHCRSVQDWNGASGRLVLLQPQGQEVPDGDTHEPGHGCRVLEGDGEGQGYLPRQRRQWEDWAEEDPGVLHWQGTPRQEDGVDHARVPPRRRQHRSSC